jgi:glycine cleavage system aminomethyltransferase T
MLNRRGRIELETIIVKLAGDRFYLICAAFFEQRLLDHLVLHRGDDVFDILNRSDQWSALSLNGPRARKLLAFAYLKPQAALCGTDLVVIIACEPRKAQVPEQAAYDPDNLLPRTDAAFDFAEQGATR